MYNISPLTQQFHFLNFILQVFVPIYYFQEDF